MLINDLLGLLEDLPRTLAGGWAAWLFAGLLLSVWQRRESRRLVLQPVTPRHKSAARPPSGAPSPRPVKQAPVTSGDAFGELEALLEEPAGTHRMPGEAPVLTSSTGAPMAALAAPQSLP